MAITESPLRYPGGKSSLFPLASDIINLNNLSNCTYIEPFAGGCGLALKLLFTSCVQEIVINDFDPSIYSFWYSVLNYPEAFCEKINLVPLNMNEWYKQKQIFLEKGNGNILEYGFSTFFLNRTNVSGVLKGGVIGGNDQTGKYKIDARFNRTALCSKIQKIASYKNYIHLYNMDVLDFIHGIVPSIRNPFINFDPPYVHKGSCLYTNFFCESDHRRIGKEILKLNVNWMMTYDNCALIQEIYQNFKRCLIPISYSAGSTKKAKEIGIFSSDLEIPDYLELLV